MAGRLANQLAPSDTQPQAMSDLDGDRAGDEQQSPVHADGAQNGKSPSAETAAKAQEAADRLPSTKKRQPVKAAQKQVGLHDQSRHQMPQTSSGMHALACHILTPFGMGYVVL